MIRYEKAVEGGPTYPDHHHIHVERPDDFDLEGWTPWLVTEALQNGRKVVVHLGLDSMADVVVVEVP